MHQTIYVFFSSEHPVSADATFSVMGQGLTILVSRIVELLVAKFRLKSLIVKYINRCVYSKNLSLIFQLQCLPEPILLRDLVGMAVCISLMR